MHHSGSIMGSGTLYTPPPERKPIVYYWVEAREKVTLPSIIRYVQDVQILLRCLLLTVVQP